MSESSARDSLSSVSDTVDGVATPDNLSLSSLSTDSSTHPPDTRVDGGRVNGNTDSDAASCVSDTESVVSRSRPVTQPTLEDVQQLLTCTACKKTFDNPKILICFHSFCAKCIQTYREGTVDFVICSHCRTCQPMPPDGIQGLTPSYTVEDLLDITKTSQGQSDQCQACEKHVKPEHICTTCNVAICNQCQVAHSNLPITKNHTVLPITFASSTPLSMCAGKRVVICKEHQDAVVYMCVPCGVFICHADWKSEHRDHEIESISEVRQRMKRNAAELERKVKQSILSSKSEETLARCRQERLGVKFTDIESVIDQVVSELETTVRAAAFGLKGKLQANKQRENEKICEVISDATKRLESSQHLRRMLLSLSKESNDLDALTFLSYCEQQYESSGQKNHANKILDSDIVFIKSQLLGQVMSFPTIGEVREIGNYPKLKPPQVLGSFDIIARVSGIAVNKYMEVVCISYHDRKCVMYDERGNVIRDLSSQVVRPWDVTFTDAGTFVITDCGDTPGHGSVKLFSPAGSLVKVVEANVKSPAGVTLDGCGRMYICYEHACLVKVTGSDGQIIGELKMWNGEYMFQGPIYIAVNINNDVVVCDDHRSVKIISPGGEPKGKYEVDSNSELNSVLVDSFGQIIVSDNQMNGLHVLTVSGRLRRIVPLDDVPGLNNIRCASMTPLQHVMAVTDSKVFILDLFS